MSLCHFAMSLANFDTARKQRIQNPTNVRPVLKCDFDKKTHLLFLSKGLIKIFLVYLFVYSCIHAEICKQKNLPVTKDFCL